MHLGVIVPPGSGIRAGDQKAYAFCSLFVFVCVFIVVAVCSEWTEGEVLLLDDSFEHEVWNTGKQTRLILIVDVWHPELPAVHRIESFKKPSPEVSDYF